MKVETVFDSMTNTFLTTFQDGKRKRNYLSFAVNLINKYYEDKGE
jgi:hypothetical protein